MGGSRDDGGGRCSGRREMALADAVGDDVAQRVRAGGPP